MDFGITNKFKGGISIGELLPSNSQTPQQYQPQPQYQQPPQQQYQQPQQQPYQQPSQQQYQQPPQQQQTGGSNLQKGQKVSLSKMAPSIDNIMVGLGWDVDNQSGSQLDLDVEVFMLGDNEKVLGDEWFVFYNKLLSPDGSVRHSGDNRTGLTAGDDEMINIQLSRMDTRVKKLTFVVTINEARERGHNFSRIRNAYIRVVDAQFDRELVRFNLTEYYPNVISMVVGEIYFHGGEWKFNPVGDGTSDELTGLCTKYGVNF
jgi:tellurium resistance protein TerD